MRPPRSDLMATTTKLATKRARLNRIRHLVGHVPYESAKRDGRREPDYPYKCVPEKF
jgi:hypothetical protein